MFHNIFEKLRIIKRKKIKPRIIVDVYEKNSLIIAELENTKEIQIEIRSLKIADYIIGKIAIERKTVSDFISSMISKRLIGQLKQMQKYKTRILIIEGNSEELYSQETKLNPNAIRGFIISIITNYDTNIIFTRDYKDTSKYLATLAKQQIKEKKDISLHSRIPKTQKEQKKYILESFRGIGPKKSEALLKKFKNLRNIFNATEQELGEILKNKSKDFMNLINL